MNIASKTVKQTILETLNEDQRKPVVDYFGPSMICACPGSGKTHAIVSRASYMIEEGIDPASILMFTFTRKGATEIRERVENKIGAKATGITIGTYHSFCSRLLRKYCQYLGWRTNFTTYDTDDKLKLLKTIITNSNIKPQIVANLISNWKDRMISPSQAMATAETDYEIYSAGCYEVYQQKIKEHNAFDFDDLIYYTIRLFEQYPDVQAEINNRYQFIMADEFQDSSERDIELILHLGGEQMNICLIMDDEQSIYGFRGANIQSVFQLIENLPNLKQFTLGQNYRSTKTIVEAARSVILNNSLQLEKKVFTNNKQGEKIVYFECSDTNAEALQVIKIIMGLTRRKLKPGEKQINYGDIAVLYRMSYLSRVVEEYFLKNGIKYTIVGGCPFYARKEIKDIMAYLHFIYNPQDTQAFQRIINTPKRGIGDKTLELILSCQTKSSCDNIENTGMLMQACKSISLKGVAKKGLEQFIATIEHLNQFIIVNDAPPLKAITEIVRITGYNDYLIATEKQDAEEKISNVAELAEIAGQYDTLEDFICNMALNNIDIEDTEDDEKNKVKLLTMHSSKGLEFPVVIIIGNNDGIIPHYKADTVNSIDEERRLLYVAMTRAEELLFLLRPKTMPMNGISNYCKESRFVQEIEPDYIVKIS